MASEVTLQNVKDWLGITNDDHDTVLTIILNSMCKAVLNYTEASFTTQVVTGELLDGNQSDAITPRNTPIQSVQAVYFSVNTDGSGGQLIDSSSYYLPKDMDEYETFDGSGEKGSSGILLRFLQTPRNRGMVRVDYTYGYDGMPPDVIHAILLACEADFRRKGRKSIGTSGRSKKDESERFSNPLSAWDKKTGLPQEVVYKLNPYRVFEFPTQPMATVNK